MTPRPNPDEASEQVEAYGAEKVLIRAWLSADALEGTHLQPREIHRLAARIRGYMDLCAAEAVKAREAERIAKDLDATQVIWAKTMAAELRARHAATKETT